MAWSVGILAAPAPAVACVSKDNAIADSVSGAAGVWIGISGNTVMIKVQNFMAHPPQTGSASCACGLQKVPSLAMLMEAKVFKAGTNEEMTAFDFSLQESVGDEFAGVDGEPGAEWVGFEATVNQGVPPTPVDLVFMGTLSPQATFATLRADLVAAGNSIGVGERNSGSGLQVCAPSVIDPLPARKAAPFIQVRRMEMGDARSVELSVRDVEEGLSALRITEAVNFSETLPAFDRGATAPVFVKFAMAEGQPLGAFGIEACNVAGDCATLRADLAIMQLGRTGLATRSLPLDSDDERLIMIQNGAPGIRTFTLNAAGRRSSVRPLASGQTVILEGALPPSDNGEPSTIVTRGASGGEAMVLVVESTDGEPDHP